LPQSNISNLIQLQMRHAPLAGYLHRIGKTDSPHCLSCWEAIGKAIKETVQHYILYCPAYA
ncbi:hypothetical protein BDQ12DRAFT_583936, partial [Crucibulum laeve]